MASNARQIGRSAYTNSALWKLVREVALKAKPDRPWKLSTREFDRARALVGHPDAPLPAGLQSGSAYHGPISSSECSTTRPM